MYSSTAVGCREHKLVRVGGMTSFALGANKYIFAKKYDKPPSRIRPLGRVSYKISYLPFRQTTSLRVGAIESPVTMHVFIHSCRLQRTQISESWRYDKKYDKPPSRIRPLGRVSYKISYLPFRQTTSFSPANPKYFCNTKSGCHRKPSNDACIHPQL
jgi:hypothetical protein